MREELGWGWARDRKPQRVGEEQGLRAPGWAAGLGAAWSRPAGGNLTTSAPLGGAIVASPAPPPPRVVNSAGRDWGLMSVFQRAIPLRAVYLPGPSFRSLHLAG